MYHNKKLILSLVLVLLSHFGYAQRYRNGKESFGILVGGSNYFGDLAPEIVPNETHLALGVFYKNHHSSYFSSRYQFLYGNISGNDKNFAANSYRNLSFKSNIWELGYNLEFNFQKFGINVNDKPATTYVFSGFNMFMFNPKAKLPGGKDEVSLQRMGTEGQVIDNKRKYALIQPSLNLGLGYKFNSGRWVIGTEIGFRKTFTDYLDDTKGNYPDYTTINTKQGADAAILSHRHVNEGNPPAAGGSMRGDSHLKDWYFVFGITISLRNITIFCPNNF